MKIVLYSLCFLIGLNCCFAQITPKVDERFELTSIAFRLADAEEYSQCRIPEYAEAIDSYFGDFKNHALINYIREIRNTQWVSYNAVATSTDILLIDDGKLILHPAADTARLFKLDPRWTSDSFDKYLGLLNDFYKETDFKRFFDSQVALREAAEEKFGTLLAEINMDWFKSFYGVDLGTPNVSISLTNGPSN